MIHYKKEKVNIEIINVIANTVRKYYKDSKEKDIDNINNKYEGTERIKQIKKIEDKYSEKKDKNAILVLESRLTELKRNVDKQNEVKEIYEEIVSTDNKKVRKIIGKELDKKKSETGRIYLKALNSKEMQKVEGIRGNKNGLFIEKHEDGFNIGDIGDKVFGKDAYKEFFKEAFYNERHKDIDIQEKEEIKPMQYVKDEIEEIEDVKAYWNSEEFQNYVKKMEKEDPKNAYRYQKAQIKKIKSVNELIGLYKEVDENRASLIKIENAIQKLKESKDVLSDNVFKKCHKILSKQQKQQLKKEKGLEARKNNIMGRTTLKQSINNAKEYHEKNSELRAISSQEDLEKSLKNMRSKLNDQKKELLEEEKENSKFWEKEKYITNGEQAYGTGEIEIENPGIAIPAMKEEIKKLEQEISKQERFIIEKREAKQQLETSISRIHAREVESTIKGEKANSLTLNEGKEEIVTKGNADFVQKVTIDYTKVQNNINSKQNDINKNKENEGRL